MIAKVSCWAAFFAASLILHGCNDPSEPKASFAFLIQNITTTPGGVVALNLPPGAPNLDVTSSCDESTWPDKDHGLVCGDCKVLVNRFSSYYSNCDGYCEAISMDCADAW